MTTEQLKELQRRADQMLNAYQEGHNLKAYDVLLLLKDCLSCHAAHREARN